MAEIEETQRRIAAALSRIDAGVEALRAESAATVDIAEFEALKAALAEEKRVAGDLRDRIAELQERHAAELDAARAQSGPAMAAIDSELQRLKTTTRGLRENNHALRGALEAGGAEPELINQSMAMELEALRAERAAEVAETSAILAALEPLLSGQREDA